MTADIAEIAEIAEIADTGDASQTPRLRPPVVGELDVLATFVDEIGWALARRRAAHTRRLGRRGITGSQTMLLFHLRMRGDMPMGRLADLLGIGLPNLTGIVDRMEERGLVERRRVPDDRRLVLVSLTAEGRRIPEEIEGVQRELLAATFEALDEDRLRACLAALREATSRTDDQDIGPGCTRPDALHDTTETAGGTTDRATC
jgi:MarR family transcriptional regulator for hemolysin